MSIVHQGDLADRPWGGLLWRLASKAFSGEIAINVAGKDVRLALHQGLLVGGESPYAADGALRLAAQSQVVSAAQVASLAGKVTGTRAEADAVGRLAGLSMQDTARLRRRAIAQAAARTFQVEQGALQVDDRTSIDTAESLALDIRTIIMVGARQHFTQERARVEVARFGDVFVLPVSDDTALGPFALSPVEQLVVEALAREATFDQICRRCPQTDPTLVGAVMYALLCGGLLNVTQGAPTHRQRTASLGNQSSGHSGVRPVPSATPYSGVHPVPRAGTQSGVHRVPSVTDQGRLYGGGRRMPSQSGGPDQTSNAAAAEILINEKMAIVERGGDHYELLGLDRAAQDAAIAKAYFALARQLHPDKIAALGIDDETRAAEKVFAQINLAFAVLSDKAKRVEYHEVLKAGGSAAMRQKQAELQKATAAMIAAEEAFHRGEHALRSEDFRTALQEFERAIALNDKEGEYLAYKGWCIWVAATDRVAALAKVQPMFEHALKLAPNGASVPFFLGRIARIEGRLDEAMTYFQRVLARQPSHQEAKIEIRAIRARRGR
ncbi:MAG: DnaJ domain-containing protein [Myxococcales bacterium]|nr:DnaJ domain-containing protein [Myxococcales bacterium]